MLSTDTQDLLELDVQEFELTDSPADAPTQSGPVRTITTCAIC
ncbi:hypothetical protein ACFFQW_19880 [Umezawaea endophytica]|uniref:Uncharacterized protein n=1 Tax=Umezawaea endophytica TaxID=1654476 RepID=A0A9X2VNG9_9PSEU|nr:hypothetical protein [Umezawaea endophytica]MCS7479667.1 hypothetical protein [Umezawaea endophytica]